MIKYRSIEICAGAGGQALGLEQAGFDHEVLIEIEKLACETLRLNRPNWKVLNDNVKYFSAKEYRDIDLFAGGVPCPPFSIAGKQLGASDERDLFPEALRLIAECNPKAVMLENVRGLLDKKFNNYREAIISELKILGYESDWQLINALDFGVSQLRPRAILIAMKPEYFSYFKWPEKEPATTLIGELLFDEMSSLGWESVQQWKVKANGIAPTLVGGSKKHGGADLGPTRARKAWALLGVDGSGLADKPPVNGFSAMPDFALEIAA